MSQQNNQNSTQQQAGELRLTTEVVAHLQRIADRSGDPILKDTANKARSACSKGLNDAPGVHLTRITKDQAVELVNLAIHTQNHEIADFARYCQSVADTTEIGIEPSPGKINEEIQKGRQLMQEGRKHTGPGYGAAFASVEQQQGKQGQAQQGQQGQQSQQAQQRQNLQLNISQVSHIMRIADRTGDPLLKDTARRAHSAWARGLSDDANVHLTWITPEQANELVNLAVKTQDKELADFARYCQSVASTSGIGLEPTPGKIQQELEKGRQEFQQQGAAHTGPGYGAAFASVGGQQGQQRQQGGQGYDWNTARSGNLRLTMDVVAHIQRIADRTGNATLKETANRAHSACVRGLNEAQGVHLTWINEQQANELVNLAVQTQDKELADFARYCQSVAQTTHIGVEPIPGKIQEELANGRQELQQQGRAHTGPGYGAAFSSQGSQQQQGSQQRQGSQQQQGQQTGVLQPGIDQSSSQQPQNTQQRPANLQPGIDQSEPGLPGVLQPGIDQSAPQQKQEQAATDKTPSTQSM